MDRRGVAAPSPDRRLPVAVALAVVYAALYKLIELGTSFGSSIGAAFWPAAGVTLAVLVLRPRREWPVYVAVVLVTETLMDLQADFSVPVSVGMGVANAVEALLGAHLLRRRTGRPPDLSRLYDLGWFFAAAVVAGPALGAVVGAGWPWILGVDPLWPRLGRWFVGDAVGVLVVAPVILSHALPKLRQRLRRSDLWTLAALAGVAALSLPWEWAPDVGLPFVLIPALTLAGLRLGTRTAAIGVFVISAFVETATCIGHGPFAQEGAFSGLVAAQVYLATCSIAALTAAALMADLTSQQQLALHDSLTGLPNRRALMDRLEVAHHHVARSGRLVGLVFVDLNHFKAINDNYGHHAGDTVLVETARRLEAAVREQDSVARLGGDEFVVLADGLADDAALAEIVDRVRAAVAAPVGVAEDTVVAVEASVGYAVAAPDEDPDTLMRRADREMYRSKLAGR